LRQKKAFQAEKRDTRVTAGRRDRSGVWRGPDDPLPPGRWSGRGSLASTC